MSTNKPDPGDELCQWISQAEAARIQGVSRQAIHKLVKAGRLRTKDVGGHLLVHRADVESDTSGTPGRPRMGESREVERLWRIVSQATPAARLEVLRRLREEIPIHSLESRLGIRAEVLLEAIERSGDLTLRMIRGVIAESAFHEYALKRLEGWLVIETTADPPYDYLLRAPDHRKVRIQVKLQRSKGNRPLLGSEVRRSLGYASSFFVVETQRTRSGTNKQTGETTRPYRFGEFDILAVAMQPSNGSWESFLYTVADWLIPKADRPGDLETFQPVPPGPNNDWTDNLVTCLAWLEKKEQRTIGRGPSAPGST